MQRDATLHAIIKENDLLQQRKDLFDALREAETALIGYMGAAEAETNPTMLRIQGVVHKYSPLFEEVTHD